MRLELDGAAAIDDPTPEQVDQALRALQPDSTYAILERGTSSYLQTAIDGGGRYLLELQDGSPDQHYRVPRPVPLQEVIDAFASYLSGDDRWRAGHDWERMDATPAPAVARPRRRRRQMSHGRVFARLGVGLVWGLVQLAILGLLFTAGGLVGALGVLVVPRYFGLPLAIGFVAGTVAGLLVDHSARGWLLSLRLRRLRARGQRVMAAVEWVGEQFAASGRGPGTTTYTVYVQWRDPVTGVDHQYDRQYRFWSSAPPRFEAMLDQASVPVLYAPARPSGFVIDIPFAPTMADLVMGERAGQVRDAPAPPLRVASSDGGTSAGRAAFFAVLGLACLALGAALLRIGGEAMLGATGIAGEPGRVLVTTCARGGGQSCSGLFTPSSDAAPPSVVSIDGSYPPGTLVGDVHLLGGEAWPPPRDAVAHVVVSNLAGLLLVAGAAGSARLVSGACARPVPRAERVGRTATGIRR
jgi:hypothetical protein